MGAIIIRIKRLSIRLVVILMIWIVFAHQHLINYRYTWYYRYRTDETELHLKMNEQHRLAQIYWNQLLKTPHSNQTFPSDICTVLISSSRDTHPTLHYTLSSLVSSMTSEEKLNTKILVYNTARPSYRNKYAQQLSQAQIPFLKVINSSRFESKLYLKQSQFDKEYHKWIWTESLDYLSALSLCQSTNSNNILILQDDLIFTKHFFQKLRTILNKNPNCNSIRLFKSDFWDGWQLEDTPILILLAGCISLLIMFICLGIDNRKCYRSRWCILETYERFCNIPPLPQFIFLIFWLIWFLFVVVMLSSTGRQNFQFLVGPREGVYPMKSSVSGALAQVYPRWTMPLLEEFLRKRLKQTLLLKKPKPIDVLLNEFSKEVNIKFDQCYVVPDLVDHIGVYSSSIKKNQGSFISMKQSGTFQSNEAAIDFHFI